MRVTLGSQVGTVITVASRSGQSTRHHDKYMGPSSQTLFSLPANKNVQMDRKVQDFAEET